jgi:hypothetical protein
MDHNPGTFYPKLPYSHHPVTAVNHGSSICRYIARLIIPQRKYKTNQRKKQLFGCRQLLIIEASFRATFKASIFTKLSTHCAFS